MVTGTDVMGRFSVDVDLASYDDLARARAGDIPAQQVRRLRIRGVVDSGATRLVVPERVVRELGLTITGQAGVRYGDGRTAQRPMAGGVHLTWGGRSSVFNAIVEPDRDSALIGAIVLEDLDLIVDCTTQTLRPRDPKQIISEVE
jgi:predicted aspartyl protease